MRMEKRSGFDDWVDTDERAVEWGLRFACTENKTIATCFANRKKSNLRYMCGNTPKRVTDMGFISAV